MSALAEHLEVISQVVQDGKSSGWDDERIGLIGKAIQSFQEWTEKIEDRFLRLEAKVSTNKSKLAEIHQVLELVDSQGPEGAANAEETPRERTSKEVSSLVQLDTDVKHLRRGRRLQRQSEQDIIGDVAVEDGLHQDMDESESESKPGNTSSSGTVIEDAEAATSKGSSRSAAKKKRRESSDVSQVEPKRAKTKNKRLQDETIPVAESTNEGLATTPSLKRSSEVPGYECQTCGKSFLVFKSYKDDQRYHSLGKLKCHLCPYEVIASGTFQLHFRTTHPGCSPTKFPPFEVEVPESGYQPFACPIEACAKRYRTNRTLRKHIKRRHHQEQEPLKCPLCEYETHFKSFFDRHMKGSRHPKPNQDLKRWEKMFSEPRQRVSKSEPKSTNSSAAETADPPRKGKATPKIKLAFPTPKAGGTKPRRSRLIKSATNDKISVAPTVPRRSRNSEPGPSGPSKRNTSAFKATRTTRQSLLRSGALLDDFHSLEADVSSSRGWEQLESPLPTWHTEDDSPEEDSSSIRNGEQLESPCPPERIEDDSPKPNARDEDNSMQLQSSEPPQPYSPTSNGQLIVDDFNSPPKKNLRDRDKSEPSLESSKHSPEVPPTTPSIREEAESVAPENVENFVDTGHVIECPLCAQSFRKLRRLDRHLQKKH